MTNLLDRLEDLQQLWLGLRITKHILLFDPTSDVQPELQAATPNRLFDNLIELFINSIIRPRITTGDGMRRFVRQADLYALLHKKNVKRNLLWNLYLGKLKYKENKDYFFPHHISY